MAEPTTRLSRPLLIPTIDQPSGPQDYEVYEAHDWNGNDILNFSAGDSISQLAHNSYQNVAPNAITQADLLRILPKGSAQYFGGAGKPLWNATRQVPLTELSEESIRLFERNTGLVFNREDPLSTANLIEGLADAENVKLPTTVRCRAIGNIVSYSEKNELLVAKKLLAFAQNDSSREVRLEALFSLHNLILGRLNSINYKFGTNPSDRGALIELIQGLGTASQKYPDTGLETERFETKIVSILQDLQHSYVVFKFRGSLEGYFALSLAKIYHQEGQSEELKRIILMNLWSDDTSTEARELALQATRESSADLRYLALENIFRWTPDRSPKVLEALAKLAKDSDPKIQKFAKLLHYRWDLKSFGEELKARTGSARDLNALARVAKTWIEEIKKATEERSFIRAHMMATMAFAINDYLDTEVNKSHGKTHSPEVVTGLLVLGLLRDSDLDIRSWVTATLTRTVDALLRQDLLSAKQIDFLKAQSSYLKGIIEGYKPRRPPTPAGPEGDLSLEIPTGEGNFSFTLPSREDDKKIIKSRR